MLLNVNSPESNANSTENIRDLVVRKFFHRLLLAFGVSIELVFCSRGTVYLAAHLFRVLLKYFSLFMRLARIGIVQ